MRNPETGAYIMNDAESKLVEALLSGKYQQTTKRLRSNGAYCCLGVACDISGKGKWFSGKGKWELLTLKGWQYVVNDEWKDCALPDDIRLSLNWNHSEATTLIYNREKKQMYLDYLNDQGFTFSQIADIIKAGLVVHAGEYYWPTSSARQPATTADTSMAALEG